MKLRSSGYSLKKKKTSHTLKNEVATKTATCNSMKIKVKV